MLVKNAFPMVGCKNPHLYQSEFLRGKLYQAPVSKCFLASIIVSGFGVSRWNGSLGGAVSGWPFFQFLLHLDKNNHWTEHWDSNGRVRGRTEGAEGDCNPIGRTTISTNQTPTLELPESKPPIKEYTWLQLHLQQRIPLSGISERGSPWSCGGLISYCRVVLEQ